MIDNVVVQWTLTGLFLVLSGYVCVRIVADRSHLIQLVGHLFHLAMALDMALMWWPAWNRVDSTTQIVVFTAGAAFFGMLALGAARTTPRTPPVVRRTWHQLTHLVMMLAMVWMVASMSTAGATGTTSTSAQVHDHGSLSGWPAYTGVLCTAALIIAGTVFVVELLDSRDTDKRTAADRGSFLSNAAMSFGMAIMGWLMLTS